MSEVMSNPMNIVDTKNKLLQLRSATSDEPTKAILLEAMDRVEGRHMEVLFSIIETPPVPTPLEALKALVEMYIVEMYIANRDSKHEFIVCFTAEHSNMLTADQRLESELWSAWDAARAAIIKAEADIERETMMRNHD